MDFLQLVTGRESIRNYDPDQTISRDVLAKILEAGRMAPSAVNFQPWQFLVVSSPDMLTTVRQCYPRAWFIKAPHILIVLGNKDAAWKRADGYNSIETDLTIAMDHMILAAESMGVATCWVANFDNESLRSALQLADNEVVFAITPLGYPNDDFQKKGSKARKPFDEIVRFI